MLRLSQYLLVLFFTAGIWGSDASVSPQPATPAVASVVDPGVVNVLVTDNGSKYHTRDCRYAKQGRSEPLATALKDGLAPCDVCHPPIYDPTLVTVYTGGDKSSKYHTKECRFAKTPETLAKASEDGQEPCKVCHAPPLPPARHH